MKRLMAIETELKGLALQLHDQGSLKASRKAWVAVHAVEDLRATVEQAIARDERKL